MAQFDLCPKCGAVAKDGQCSSCGYKIPGIYGKSDKPITDQTNDFGREPQQPTPVNLWNTKETANSTAQSNAEQNVQNNNQQQNTYQQYTWVQDKDGKWVQVSDTKQAATVSGKSSVTCLVIALVAILAIMVIITAFVAYGIRKNVLGTVNSVNSGNNTSGLELPSVTINGQDLTKYGSYSGNLRDILFENTEFFVYNEWVTLNDDPYSGTDPQAYEFDNYIDGKVSYKIETDNWGFLNGDGAYNIPDENFYLPTNLEMYGTYYRLSNTGLANEEEINSMILKKSMQIGDMGELATYYPSDSETAVLFSQAYVTYMDADVISFIFLYEGYLTEGDSEEYSSIMSHIVSLNINLKTGKEISAEETFDFGGDFYQVFKDRCLEQNGSPADFYEDEVLAKLLSDDLYVVWVYTPLGLEVGLNRDVYSGWATGTFTDFSKFIKVY